MIICERCSTENPDGARYCDECGAALWLAGRAGAISPNGEQSKRSNGSAMKPVTENLASPGSTRASDGGAIPDVDLDDDDPEAKVSRRHARIMRDEGDYFIEDLGSTNGTFVNRGRRLIPGNRQVLRDGDEIIVGKTFLRFHVTR